MSVAAEVLIKGEYRTSEAEDVQPFVKTLTLPYDERFNHSLHFGSLSTNEHLRISDLPRKGPWPIGIHRRPNSAEHMDFTRSITWQLTERGWLGTATVSSAQAKSVRLELEIETRGPIEIVFFEFDQLGNTVVLDTVSLPTETPPISEAMRHQPPVVTETLWSPSAEGNVIGMEFVAPDRFSRDSLSINIAHLAHRFESVSPTLQSQHVPAASYSVPPVDLDVSACEDEHAACHSSSFSADVANAVLVVVFEIGSGTFVCTGTLINDSKPGTQHFVLTANHCVGNSTVAGTVYTNWFHQRRSCSSATVDTRRQLIFGGATYVTGQEANDWSLINLKTSPPAGVYYAGISTASSDVAAGTQLYSIHQAKGNHKRYYRGTVEGLGTVRYYINGVEVLFTNRLLTKNTVGLITNGSSGSGLFNGSNIVAVHEGATDPESCGGKSISNAIGKFYSILQPHIAPTTPTPTVSFDASVSSSAENLSTTDVKVNISAAPSSAISVTFTVGGTAGSADFSTPSNTRTVSISANSTSSDISISIVNDSLFEGDETVVLTLVDGTNYDLGSTTTHTLTITDDDTKPSAVSLSLAPTSIAEDAGASDVTVTATVSGTVLWSTAQTIAISADGSGASDVVGFGAVSDFNLTIPAAASSGSGKFSITPTNDNVETNNETVTVSGALTGVTVSSASLTLTDDDTAPTAITLSLSPTSVSEGAGATDVTVTATIDGTSRFTTDQTIAISVDDSGASGVVGFPAVSDFNLTLSKGTSSGSAKFSITPTNDNFDTSNETVTVSGTLTGVTVSSATLTLTDDDSAPSAITLTLSPTTVSEDAGATDVTVTATIDGASRLSSDQTLVISVDDSGASNVVGFTDVSNFNLTIPKNTASGTAKFSITPTDDDLNTGNETVTVGGTLTGVTVSSAKLTLTNDDAAPSAIALSLSPTTIAESAGATEVTVTATVSGTARWGDAQTISISVDDSGGSNVVGFADVSNFNLTIAKGASSGTAKFSISPTNDNFDTSNETVTVSGNLTGVTVSSASLTLTDDDTAPSAITLSLSPTSVSEGAGATDVTVTATISGSSRFAADQTIVISVDGSGASDVVGFAAVSDFNLTFSKGAISGTAKFSITPTNDNFETSNETVTVSGTLAGVTVSSASLTLTDDDTAPTAITLSLSPTSVSEGAGATDVTVTATISGTSRFAADQTIAISVDGSGASGVVGFAAVSDFNLILSKGASSGTAKFSITPTNDNFDTGNETVTVSGTLTGVTVSSATLSLTDDDAAPSAVSLSLSPTTVSEDAGATDVTVTATIDGATRFTADQSIVISVDDSGASNVVGFADVSNFNLTIPKNTAYGSAKFSITPTDDDRHTGNETVTVDGALTGVTVSSAKLTLTNDDAAPSAIALSLSPTTIAESAGATEVTVTATVSGTARWGNAQTISISVDDSGGSNVVGFADVSNFNLTIAKGAGSGTEKFSISPTNDNLDTSNETVTVSGSLTGVTVSSASLTLTDDDTAPSAVTLTVSPTTVSEGAGATDVTVTATISGSSRFAADQTIAISVDGSGASGVVGFAAVSDFSLSIPKGTASGTAKFSITPTNDNFDTGNETVTVSGTMAGITVSSASLSLTDDDTAPSEVSLSLSPTTVSEASGSTDVTVTATIDGTSRFAADQTIAISVDGSGASGVVGFAAVSDFNLTLLKGSSTGTAKFSITPTNDNFDTGNETVTVSGTLTGVTVSSATLSLTDDDAAPSAVSLSLSPSNISEDAGATDVTVTATIDGASRFTADQTIVISVDDSGASNVVGFAAVSNFNLTIPKNTPSGTAKFSITPTDDDLHTGNETVSVGGTLAGAAVSSAKLTLTNDDPLPTTTALSLSPTTVSEGAGTTEVTVTASIEGNSRWGTGQTISISVDDSSTSGVVGFTAVSDFNLTIPSGVSSGTAKFSITPTDDNIDASNETITVSGVLTGVTVKPVSLTLTDNDVAPTAIVLSLSPTVVDEGDGPTPVTVTATVSGSSRWNSAQIVAISVNDSGSNSVVGFSPVASFNLTIARAAASGSNSFTLTPINDSLSNGVETVTVGGSLTGVTVTPASLTLTNDDTQPIVLAITASDASGVIEGTAASYTLRAVPPPVSSIAVNLSVTEPSNTGFVAPSDIGSDTVIMPADGIINYTVDTRADSVDEPNGQMIVTINSGNAYIIGSASSASVSLIDNDATSVAISRAGATTLMEDGGTETIEITLSRSLLEGETVVAPLSVSGSSITPSDYTLKLTSGADLNVGVSWLTDAPHSNAEPAIAFTGDALANVQSATLTLTAVDDNDAVASETLNIGFGSGSRSVISNLDRLSGTGTSGTNASGSVSIEINDPHVLPPPAKDHGDTRDEAVVVGANSITGSAIEESGDVDYFRFTTAERGDITITSHGVANIHCALEDSEGRVIEHDDGADGRCLIESYQEQGTYWINVTGESTSTGLYSLKIVVEYDDISDDVSQPHEMRVNSTFASRLGEPGDTDYYAVTIEDEAEGRLHIYTLGNTDTMGCEYDDRTHPDKEVWRCDDDSGQGKNFQLEIVVTEENRYLFSVQGHQDTVGRYVLVLEFHQSEETEPDGSETTVHIASTAVNWSFQIPSTLATTAEDVFQVIIPRAGQFLVRVTGEPDTTIRLISASEAEDDNRSESDIEGDSISGDQISLTGGKYYILVKGVTETEQGEYQLHLQYEPPDALELPSVL